MLQSRGRAEKKIVHVAYLGSPDEPAMAQACRRGSPPLPRADALPLVVRIAVVLAGAVVLVAVGARIERRKLLQPALVVLVQPRLVIVDEDAGGDVHGISSRLDLVHRSLRA